MTRTQRVLLFTLTMWVTVAAGVAIWGRPDRMHRTAPGAEGSAAGVTWDSEPAFPVTQWDPAVLQELKQEGIDLADLAEIRALLRAALTVQDPAEKMRLTAELKRRFGLEADSGLLGRIDMAAGRPRLTLTERGRRLASGIAQRFSRAWDRVMEEVDR